ncbi:copper homeostasis protein CutC [Pedobacter yulinensis]|uniref:PF03932 family protein CutC n=1 Tax=Pedobacter yulinensis TaxID=2126353 RepID=A0A2T3HKM3_9SPHI|nr:copper homeostasis protein CutC [Pedobacter yulinensis]PST83008.1 copper homeostasis protein CutC [Pedobacter yulinensis]
MTGIEVCANSLPSALAAQEGGAIRVEFCDNLAEGGTTPSAGQLLLARQSLHIGLWPIIRPRGGDFLYSDLEFRIMQEDIKLCKSIGCDGVVTGILMADGQIDTARMRQLVELALPMPLAFHRAFDMSRNFEEALGELIGLGIKRVLSSGGKSSAWAGRETLAALVKLAQAQIEIMPGAGVNAENIGELRATGATQFHASCKTSISSRMNFRNHDALMGSLTDEYSYEQTTAARVRELVNALQAAG